MKILSFGEILWDVFPEKSVIGGAPFNFAAHCARLGAEAYLLSAVGNDSLGADTLKEIAEKKVRGDYIGVISDKETGKCLVTLDEDRVPSYNLLRNVAYDEIDCDPVTDNSFDLLYFGTLALREEHNRRSLARLIKKCNFGEIFVDVNIRKPFISQENVLFALENATILKISDEELDTVTGAVFGAHMSYEKAAKRIAERYRNIKLIIVTLGSKGSYLFDCTENKNYSEGTVKVETVSTVGAGDSYSAAFVCNYLKCKGIKECMSAAAKLSGFVVSKTEAVPDYDPDKI